HINIANPDGDVLAVASVTEADDGVTITVTSDDSGLDPGEHGIHIHEKGVCDPDGDDPFESAGGHFNPTDKDHGAPEDEDSHAGDLGNLTVDDDGSIDFEITRDKVTLNEGETTSLQNPPDGTSFIIHEG